MWTSLGCVPWCPCKANSPFGEFLTYLIFSLILSKAIVSCEFERVAAAMLVLLACSYKHLSNSYFRELAKAEAKS